MDEFENWVKSLPDTVYRMKGFVPVVERKILICFNMRMEWLIGCQNILKWNLVL